MKKVYILMRVDALLCSANESDYPYGKVVDVFAHRSDARRESKRLNKEQENEWTWFDILEKSIH